MNDVRLGGPRGLAGQPRKGGSSGGARIDVGQDAGVEVGLLVLAGAALPDLLGQCGDATADRLVLDDDERPRLLVLGAGGEGGGVEDLGECVVVDVVLAEVAARPLAVHHLEEVRHLPDRDRSWVPMSS